MSQKPRERDTVYLNFFKYRVLNSDKIEFTNTKPLDESLIISKPLFQHIVVDGKTLERAPFAKIHSNMLLGQKVAKL